MASQNVFKRVMDALQSIVKDAFRAFKPESDTPPKMGIVPLKHDIYKEGKRKSYSW